MSKRLAPYALRTLVALQLALVAPSAQATTVLPDPAGDSPINDILAVSGAFDDASLFLGVDFRGGTVDFSNVAIAFELDTDLDPTTGDAGTIAGAEYFVFFNSLADPAQAFVFDAGSAPLGTVGVALGGTDAFDVTVPLALLGGDDGVADFGALSGVPVPPGPGLPFGTFAISDRAPSDASNATLLRGGPTTVIPEPTAALAFGIGALVVGYRLRRRARA